MLFVESFFLSFFFFFCFVFEFHAAKMKIRNHRKVRLCRVDFSNCFVRWTGNGARKRGTIDGRFARIYSGRFIPENRAAGRLLCERHLHRFRAHECGIEGGGRNSMKKFFHEMVESKVVEEHARRSVVFQKERSSRNLGNFFKISSSCLAAATRGNRANFQAWIHWKANFAVPPTSETFRSPHFFGLFPDLGNLIREISRKGNKGARFCKSFSEIARLFV